MNISKIFGGLYLLAAIVLILTPLTSYGESGDGHFDAPSVDNYMNYHIDNVGGSTLDGLAIKWVELFEGSDPAHVISKTSLVKE